MLRIAYCTDSLMAGGIERQLIELVSRMDRTRFDPHVMYLYGPKAERSLHFLPNLQRASIPVYLLNLRWTPVDKLVGIIKIARRVWQLQPEILHAVNYHSNLLTRLARPLLPPSLKLIGSVRGEYTPKQLFYERITQRTSATIVCNSPHLQVQLVQQAHVNPRKILYIPNGVDIARFSQNPVPYLRSQLAPDASLVLVTMGRISSQKSPHLLAEALGVVKKRNALPQHMRLIIVGEKESPVIQAQLEEAIRRYELHSVIEQRTESAQPEAFYHAADVTVLASLYEGLPNVALESLAAGRPVIISEAANAAGIIEQSVTGWIVRTGDVNHLADVLCHVLNLPPEDLRRMRPACEQRAQDFSMAQMVERYERLYESLSQQINPEH